MIERAIENFMDIEQVNSTKT